VAGSQGTGAGFREQEQTSIIGIPLSLVIMPEKA